MNRLALITHLLADLLRVIAGKQSHCQAMRGALREVRQKMLTNETRRYYHGQSRALRYFIDTQMADAGVQL